MSNQVVKVRERRLRHDATTISECLHTFCRKCIYNKISDEELECCPICNTDLGCVPLEKLRPDHNLQDVRAKIFPFKRRKVKAPEVVLPVTLPVKRKERSLSSLVVSTPRVSTQTTMTGRRTKSVARKATALRGSGFSIEKLIKKEEDSVGERPASSSSPETLNKFTQNIRQNSPSAEPSIHSTPNKETENGAESWEGKFDLWKPLNCLVEVANRTKSLKFNSQGSAVKSNLCMFLMVNRKSKPKLRNMDVNLKFKMKNKHHSFVQGSPRRAAAFGELGISPQAVLNAVNNHKRRTGSIWFSLVASEDQDASLPQISSNFLRIKDVNVPVSFIQKYLMRKLDLTSETEVEIKCMGQPVLPTLQLHNLVDLWLQTASTSQRVPASIGSSGKEFVMVLAYARKLIDP
ncbi:hypothetical protein AAG906_008884 [Vitis piasezkii]